MTTTAKDLIEAGQDPTGKIFEIGKDFISWFNHTRSGISFDGCEYIWCVLREYHPKQKPSLIMRMLDGNKHFLHKSFVVVENAGCLQYAFRVGGTTKKENKILPLKVIQKQNETRETCCQCGRKLRKAQMAWSFVNFCDNCEK